MSAKVMAAVEKAVLVSQRLEEAGITVFAVYASARPETWFSIKAIGTDVDAARTALDVSATGGVKTVSFGYHELLAVIDSGDTRLCGRATLFPEAHPVHILPIPGMEGPALLAKAMSDVTHAEWDVKRCAWAARPPLGYPHGVVDSVYIKASGSFTLGTYAHLGDSSWVHKEIVEATTLEIRERWTVGEAEIFTSFAAVNC